MNIEITNGNYTIQWGGTYFIALQDYPTIHPAEFDRISKFIAYEKYYHRKTEIICNNKLLLEKITDYVAQDTPEYPFFPFSKESSAIYTEEGLCLVSDFVSHTTTIDTAKQIFTDGKLLSAVQALKKSSTDLVMDSRNAASDPADYFDYIMFAWSNVTSGYRLAMERLLHRAPTENDLNELFVPGVSFHFLYENLAKEPNFILDGYHPVKIKDKVDLDGLLFICVIPE